MTPERYQQIERLYRAALELEPKQRAAYLEDSCAEDGELRREVESLLGYQAQAENFIEQPAVEVAAQALADEQRKILVGQNISHYRIQSMLGAGGMGEVYLAEDTMLGRKVALKVLPSHFTIDAERVRRFEREARAASALNHPNIITIHEIGRTDDTHYIVTELIDGHTLRRQMESGGMSLPEALKIAVQIASAMAAAHDAGIMHRDIKPENLMVRSDGLVKVLDFGLAKLKPEQSAGGAGSETPTEKSLTGSGVILGTVGYMSPEQIHGHDADHRSDIFAFGVVLYEMLSGRKPFQGESRAETMAAIIKDEPPELSGSDCKVPGQLERIVKRCLEKHPERRFHSAHDLGFALESISTHTGSLTEPTALKRVVGGRMTRREWFAWGTIVVLLLAIALFAYFRRAPAEDATARFSIHLPEKATAFDHPAISPDGRHLAFAAMIEGKSMLWVRALDSIDARILPGTEGAKFPFWSPDSRQIGFFTQNKLKKVALSGGLPTILCDTPQAILSQGTTWGSDGKILFLASENVYDLSSVSADGGSVEQLQPKLGRADYPNLLPDGKHFLYAKAGTREGSGIYLASIDGQENRRLMPADYSRTAYTVSPEDQGYILLVREEMLIAQPFDPTEFRLTGEPVHLADHVDPGSVTVSDNGVLVYRTVAGMNKQQLEWFARSGKSLGTIGSPVNVKASSSRNMIPAALSPDGNRIAVSRLDSQTADKDIWILDMVRDNETRFTDDPGHDSDPVWSPDGTRIVWNSNRGDDSKADLYHKPVNSIGRDEALLTADYWKVPLDWSVNDDIIFQQNHPKTANDLWILSLKGKRKPYPYLVTPYNEVHARFSPDAKWISYISNKSGQRELYVQAFPSNGIEYQVSNTGVAAAQASRWRRDGKELFYVAPDGKMMAVEVRTGKTFEAGSPKALFDLKSIRGLPDYFNVTRDGQRFLIKTSVGEPDPYTVPFIVVTNWTSLLHKSH